MDTVDIKIHKRVVSGLILAKTKCNSLVAAIYDNTIILRLYSNKYINNNGYKGQYRNIDPYSLKGLASWYKQNFLLIHGQKMNYQSICDVVNAHSKIQRYEPVEIKTFESGGILYAEQCHADFKCTPWRSLRNKIPKLLSVKFAFCPFCGGQLKPVIDNKAKLPIRFSQFHEGKPLQKRFPIEAVISITTGVRLCESWMIYDIFSYALNRPVLRDEIRSLITPLKTMIYKHYPHFKAEEDLVKSVKTGELKAPIYIDRLQQDYGRNIVLPVLLKA